MRFSDLGAFIALVACAAAKCTTQQQYNTIPGFTNSNGCIPTGYFQAQDMGTTTPEKLRASCEQTCTNFSKCEVFVAQYQTAPNGLTTGQCYFYNAASVPASPQTCADHPTNLIAEQKDHTLACFSSSAKAATAYCSSYLSIETVTSYTRVTTPISTSRISTTTVSTFTSLTTTSTIFTQTSPTVLTTTTATSSTTLTSDVPSAVNKRAASTVPAPACFSSSSVEPSRISSACSCLDITKTTVYLVSTAPASTTLTTSILSAVSTTRKIVTSLTSITLPAPTQTSVTYTTTTSTVLTTGTGCAGACASQLSAMGTQASSDCLAYVVTYLTYVTPVQTLTSTSTVVQTSTSSTVLQTTITTSLTLTSQSTTFTTFSSVSTISSIFSTTVTALVTDPTIRTVQKRVVSSTSPVTTLPAYAPYCSNPAAYVSACSCIGAPPSTTILTITASTLTTSASTQVTSSTTTTQTQTSISISTATSYTTSVSSSTTFVSTTTTTSVTATATVGSQNFVLRVSGSGFSGNLVGIFSAGSTQQEYPTLKVDSARPVALCQINPNSNLVCNGLIFGSINGFYAAVADSVSGSKTSGFIPFICSIGVAPANVFTCQPDAHGSRFFSTNAGQDNLAWVLLSNAAGYTPIQLSAEFQ